MRTDPRLHKLDDFALSAELHDAVGKALDVRRMVGVPIELGTPYYQGVSVAALVRTLPGRPAAMVRQRVVDALTRFVHPLTGGADGTGWPFDTDADRDRRHAGDRGRRGRRCPSTSSSCSSTTCAPGGASAAGASRSSLEPHTLFLSAEHRVVVR